MVIIELDSLDIISSKIKLARTMLGLSQGELARAAGVSQSTIARLEKDSERLNPSYAMVHHIIEVINSLGENPEPESLSIGEAMQKKLVYVRPNEKVRKALKFMEENDYSQIPVINSKGEVVGTLYQRDIVDLITSPKKLNLKVKELMSIPMPEVDINTKISMVKPILQEWGAVLVRDKKRIVGIFTIYDLLKISKIS